MQEDEDEIISSEIASVPSPRRYPLINKDQAIKLAEQNLEDKLLIPSALITLFVREADGSIKPRTFSLNHYQQVGIEHILGRTLAIDEIMKHLDSTKYGYLSDGAAAVSAASAETENGENHFSDLYYNNLLELQKELEEPSQEVLKSAHEEGDEEEGWYYLNDDEEEDPYRYAPISYASWEDDKNAHYFGGGGGENNKNNNDIRNYLKKCWKDNLKNVSRSTYMKSKKKLENMKAHPEFLQKALLALKNEHKNYVNQNMCKWEEAYDNLNMPKDNLENKELERIKLEAEKRILEHSLKTEENLTKMGVRAENILVTLL